ncbi:hypothetical protein VaNZ11_016966 [Volvox africanus]|uniref:Uncharacterized protein n=1 Tax=Volvox africanus TaxID=51714 RepID=A0ABQ5SNW8_9CHLO|nr:hypothetical protein VaNZ11_016966 [Volvox africanus]
MAGAYVALACEQQDEFPSRATRSHNSPQRRAPMHTHTHTHMHTHARTHLQTGAASLSPLCVLLFHRQGITIIRRPNGGTPVIPQDPSEPPSAGGRLASSPSSPPASATVILSLCHGAPAHSSSCSF